MHFHSRNAILLVVVLLQACASAPGPNQVDLNQAGHGSDWLLPNRDYAGQRYAELNEITLGNVARMRSVCTFNSGETARFAGNPLVWRNTLYLTTSASTYAVNATDCTVLWKHESPGTPNAFKSRGAGLKDGKLIRATIDGHLIALDAGTGALLWESIVADPNQGEMMVMSPIIFENMVIAGIGIGEYGVKGWIGAFRLADGAPIWKFNMIPADDDPAANTWSSADARSKGGGGVWAVAPSIDVERGLLYVAVGNPAPDYFGDVREGTNLYTASLVVLDVRTGQLQWHRQFVPHDLHDHDLTVASPLYQVSIDGKRLSLVATGGKDGLLRALDLDSHQEVFSVAVTTRTNSDVPPTVTGVYTCPGVLGGLQWNAPAFSPRLNRLFVPSVDWCGTFKKAEQLRFIPGQFYMGGSVTYDPVDKSRGWLTAVDAATGAIVWKYESRLPMLAAVTATSSDLLFTGELTGDFLAIDARDGKVLYRQAVGGAIGNGVITYGVNGKQYVAVTSGTAAAFWKVPAAPASVTLFALP
jgi:alcohol dehydrogenase (cytochrome c)